MGDRTAQLIAARRGYYPDTMSRTARRLIEARRELDFWRGYLHPADHVPHLAVAGLDVPLHVEHSELVLRIQAGQLIAGPAA